MADSPALSGLAIGSLPLTPTFDADVMSYTATTTNNTNKITATSADDAEITVSVNGTEIANGTAATWLTGENTLLVSVTKDGQTTQYEVRVSKT